MDKKIVSLLNNNLRVIIPEFGAFIIRQQEPRIVVFNELLKNNDGLLTDLIVKTENAEPEVAQQLVSDYTTQAMRLLENGGSLTIEEIGVLQKDKSGKIIFIPESTSREDQVMETVAPLDMNKTNTLQDIPETGKETVSKEEIEMDKPDPEREKIISFATDPKIPWFMKHIYKWVIGIVLVNLVIIGAFLIKNKTHKKPAEVVSEQPVENAIINASVLDQLADSVRAAANDASLVFSQDETSETAASQTKTPDNLRYYIVAGCFRDEINADELVGSLKKMGYKAEKFGKIGDLYAVSFAAFSDKDLAVKELAKIREESHPDAWMTRF
jgi:nucleoid DNA-binding protein